MEVEVEVVRLSGASAGLVSGDAGHVGFVGAGAGTADVGCGSGQVTRFGDGAGLSGAGDAGGHHPELAVTPAAALCECTGPFGLCEARALSASIHQANGGRGANIYTDSAEHGAAWSHAAGRSQAAAALTGVLKMFCITHCAECVREFGRSVKFDNFV